MPDGYHGSMWLRNAFHLVFMVQQNVPSHSNRNLPYPYRKYTRNTTEICLTLSQSQKTLVAQQEIHFNFREISQRSAMMGILLHIHRHTLHKYSQDIIYMHGSKYCDFSSNRLTQYAHSPHSQPMTYYIFLPASNLVIYACLFRLLTFSIQFLNSI